MNKYMNRCALLTLTALLVGCGNSSDDRPIDDPGPILPPPIFDDYDNAVSLDLAPLVGMDGVTLWQAIETQLNESLTANLTANTPQSFKITPQWGFASQAGSWDNINLEVIEIDGEAVLQTMLGADNVGKPSIDNPVFNGFSMLIDLPNGLATNAVMSYQFHLERKIGTGSGQNPDYIFLPGLTSGSPEVANRASNPGEGFTFKYSTDRYANLNTRYMDPTDADFYNTPLLQSDNKVKVKEQAWTEVQQKLQTNEFLPGGSIPTSNGKLVTVYNSEQTSTDKGLTENRVIVEAQHAYSLQGLVETYRHYQHSSDTDPLQQQTVRFKNLTFAWDNTQLELPPEPDLPPQDTLCTATSNHVKFVDLAELYAAGATSGQDLLDGIAQQLGDLAAGSVTFDWGVNGMSIVAEAGQADSYMLQVDYAAGVDQAADGNGVGFKIPFPSSAQITGTCFAFNLNIATAINSNSDYIYFPSVEFKDGVNTLTDHRYSTNKYKRFSAKFVNPPHSDLSWLDYSGNSYVNDSTWYAIRQSMSMDNTGLGNIDFIVNNASYFKQNDGKFGGIPFADVQHQIVATDKLASMDAIANFDSYRHTPGGTNPQTFYYKDITIGWNETTD